MSSIINAYRNIISDNSWFVKAVIMTAPVFMLLNFALGKEGGISETEIAMSIIAMCLYLGIGTYMMNRNINNNSPILPNLLGIPELLFHTFFSIIVVAPGTLLCMFLLKTANTYLFLDQYMMYMIYAFIVIVCCPFVFIPLCLYAVEGKIQNVFKLKPLIDGAGNFIVAIFAFLIQYAFTIVVAWFLFYTILSAMMKDNLLINALNSFFIILTFLTFFSYVSDQYGESIPDPRRKEDIF
jgi:hypothetical protein